METLEQRIKRVLQDEVSVVAYDSAWSRMFEEEKKHLLGCLPQELIRRIEHFGSTAIPGLAAKPIVDMLVEVASLEETKTRIAPVLEAQGYDYFCRQRLVKMARRFMPGLSRETLPGFVPIISTWSRATLNTGKDCSFGIT